MTVFSDFQAVIDFVFAQNQFAFVRSYRKYRRLESSLSPWCLYCPIQVAVRSVPCLACFLFYISQFIFPTNVTYRYTLWLLLGLFTMNFRQKQSTYGNPYTGICYNNIACIVDSWQSCLEVFVHCDGVCFYFSTIFCFNMCRWHVSTYTSCIRVTALRNFLNGSVL